MEVSAGKIDLLCSQISSFLSCLRVWTGNSFWPLELLLWPAPCSSLTEGLFWSHVTWWVLVRVSFDKKCFCHLYVQDRNVDIWIQIWFSCPALNLVCAHIVNKAVWNEQPVWLALAKSWALLQLTIVRTGNFWSELDVSIKGEEAGKQLQPSDFNIPPYLYWSPSSCFPTSPIPFYP